MFSLEVTKDELIYLNQIFVTSAILRTRKEPFFIDWNTESIDRSRMPNQNEFFLRLLILAIKLWFSITYSSSLHIDSWLPCGIDCRIYMSSRTGNLLIELNILASNNIKTIWIKNEHFYRAILEATYHDISCFANSYRC